MDHFQYSVEYFISKYNIWYFNHFVVAIDSNSAFLYDNHRYLWFYHIRNFKLPSRIQHHSLFASLAWLAPILSYFAHYIAHTVHWCVLHWTLIESTILFLRNTSQQVATELLRNNTSHTTISTQWTVQKELVTKKMSG